MKVNRIAALTHCSLLLFRCCTVWISCATISSYWIHWRMKTHNNLWRDAFDCTLLHSIIMTKRYTWMEWMRFDCINMSCIYWIECRGKLNWRWNCLPDFSFANNQDNNVDNNNNELNANEQRKRKNKNIKWVRKDRETISLWASIRFVWSAFALSVHHNKLLNFPFCIIVVQDAEIILPPSMWASGSNLHTSFCIVTFGTERTASHMRLRNVPIWTQ